MTLSMVRYFFRLSLMYCSASLLGSAVCHADDMTILSSLRNLDFLDSNYFVPNSKKENIGFAFRKKTGNLKIRMN